MRFTITEVACAAALFAFAVGAQANDPGSTQRDRDYKATVAQADAEFKEAKKECASLQGNDKDVCMKKAKADHVSAVEDAKAKRKAGAAVASATDEKLEAQYKVAKEKCDSLSGDAKDACVRNAKARYHQ